MDAFRLDRYGVTPFPPGSLLVAFLCLADDDPGDAQTVCLFHAQQVTIEVDLVSLLRYSAQMVEHEAADALEVLAREVGAEGFVGFPYRDASVQAIGVLAQLNDGGPFVVELVPELVPDLPDDLFEGEEALEGASLVDDHGHLEVLLPEILQDLVYAAVLGDREHFAHQVAGRLPGGCDSFWPDGAQDVLDVHGADYAVGRVALVDGVAGVSALRRGRDQLLQARLLRESHDVGAGDHDLPRRLVVELEDRADHALLVPLQHPLAGRLGDEGSDLILRMGLVALGSRRIAQQPREGVGRTVEDHRRRQKQVVEELHERGHEQRCTLAALDGHGLGRQFSEDDVQKGDDREPDDESDNVQSAALHPEWLE